MDAPPSRMHEHLRAWRDALGLTQLEVSRQVHVTHATVSRWESGVQAIPPHKFNQLAAVYGATPAELLFSPADRAMAQRLHQAVEILQRLGEREVDQWLGIGKSLTRPAG
jgi:transcriptional regulator with XRE-family HTH domain